MPTYDEEVLADNPLFYAKLEEFSGTVLTDSSGDGRHGTYFDDVTFGIDGPVETDLSNHSCGGRVGYVEASPGSDLDLQNSFTWEGWTMINSSADTTTILARNSSFSFFGANVVGVNSGSIMAEISFGGGAGNTYLLSYGPIVPAAWYHVMVTRATNVARLYVNGILRYERTDLPITANTNGSTSYWHIGVSNNTTGASLGAGNIFAGFKTARPALYDTALNAGRALAHYEAALADLPLSATINVRVVVELDTDDTEPIDFPFTHNFAEPLSGSPRPIIEHLSFKTNDLRSQPDYSQRINAQPHHVQRVIEYFVTPTSARARAILQSALWTPGETYKLPIAKDWGVLTAQATAGANTISLDTTLRDYEIGSYVSVWEDIYSPWTAQFFEITSRADSELGISPDVGDTLPAGSTVMPARLAILPEESLSVDSHLIDRETHALQFEILSTELSPRRVTAYTPSETYKDLEIFNLERAKVEWVDPSPCQINRRFQGTGTPTGNDYQRAIDTGSPQTIPIRLLFASREAISEFYGWMEARQGKQNPVWVRSEDNDVQVLARAESPDTITVSSINYTNRYNTHQARRDLAFKLTNGDWVQKRITDADDLGDGTERMALDADPPALADIAKVSFLKLCTAPDQFELKYHRDGSDFIAECEFVFQELLTTPE